MTHAAPMPDSAGEFKDWRPVETLCHKCKAMNVKVRLWESSCGGYEDHQFRCADCGYSWWVDGIDS